MMKMFTFARRPALLKPPALRPVQAVAAKPEARAAPLARSADADGQLRRTRQVVEDNKLL